MSLYDYTFLDNSKSNCYKEKSDTDEMWIEEVAKKDITCIAVTDHNDYRGIRGIREVADQKGITVFPGVEVTCDSSKIHILVLFDVSKTDDNVRDFLSAIDIDSDLIGKSEGTTKNVFDVCEKAKRRACYLHACIKQVQGEQITNSSLRNRFGLQESSSGSVSRLIKEAVKIGLIKPLDSTTAPRYMRYIPWWA